MSSLEQRVTNLENYVTALLHKINNDEYYMNSDITANRTINDNQTTDIANNRTGIEETYETTISNADDIADVRTALEEVYEMILPEE